MYCQEMWLVESPSPAPPAPPTPTIPPANISSFSVSPVSPSLSAAALPGSRLSGRLTGVISLTDILNLFARSSGLSPVDPSEARKQRRRSSSSSHRMSLDIPRSSFELRKPPGVV